MMDCTQKKCVIGSTMLHGLLVGILLFGMAFTKKEPTAPFIEIISIPTIFKTTDGMTLGGTPLVVPPASRQMPQPPAPQPQPEPQKTVPPALQPPPKPEHKVETPIVHEARINPHAEIQVQTAPRKKIKLEPIVRNESNSTSKKTSKSTTAKTRDREAEENNARVAAALSSIKGAASTIRNHSSGSTTIEIGTGGSGGGEASVNFRQLVLSLYDQAWIDPDDVADESAAVKTEITISRDGAASGRIIKRSGIPSMDRSVQRALDRVRFVAPFPAGSKDSERTFIINFNLKSKRGLG